MRLGSGKTVIFAWIAEQVQNKGKTIWFVVHRQELLKQTYDTFKRFNIPLNTIVIEMVSAVANYPERYPKPDLIVFDECFPSNTMILTADGEKLITKLLPSDFIATYNHQKNIIEYKPVLAVSKTRPKDMVKIILENGDCIDCTSNHPIFDREKGDYINAKDIKKGSFVLRMVQTRSGTKKHYKDKAKRVLPFKENIASLFKRVCKAIFCKQKSNRYHLLRLPQKNELERYDKKSTSKLSKIKWSKSVLLDRMFRKSNSRSALSQRQNVIRGEETNFTKNEERQSYVKRRKQNKNVKAVERNRALSKSKIREWLWADSTAARIVDCIKKIRALCRILSADRFWKREWNISKLLQNRYCNPKCNVSNRSGRKFTRVVNKTSRGPEENRVLKWVRVESVEVQKQTSDGTFRGLCPDGYVYNLEVLDNHNYFANGVLVHNCHFSMANTWKKIINAYPDVYMIGLTATPCRLDGKPLGDIYNDLIVGITANELIELGYLSDYKYYAPCVSDISSLKIRGKDYDAQSATELLSQRAVFSNVINSYKKYADGLQTICYCSSIKHSEDMASEFNRNGISAVHFDGNTPPKIRADIIQRFRDGEIKILCNVDLISVGFDCPDCWCCILLRPTLSTALYIQQACRALRPAEGKTAIILDCVNNYQRHGLPTGDREWSLNSDYKPPRQTDDDGKFSVRVCEECYATFPSTEKICPVCGAEYKLTRQEIKNIAEIQLKEIKRKQEERKDNYRNKCAESVKEKTIDDCKNLTEIMAWCKANGKKSGYGYIMAKKKGMVR